MSSFRLVPPVVTITSTPKCLPSSLQTCAVCNASSLVGTSSSAWIDSSLMLMRSNVGIVKAPVFPVPFFALQIHHGVRVSSTESTSTPARITLHSPISRARYDEQRASSTACAGVCDYTPCEDVASNQRHRDTLFLDRRWVFPTLLEYPHQQLALEVVILEAISFCCSDVLHPTCPRQHMITQEGVQGLDVEPAQ